MRIGQHRNALATCTREADAVYWFQPPGMDWSLDALAAESPVPAAVSSDVAELARRVARDARPGDRVVIMSNGGFGGIHQLLLDELKAATS
jgi:UDP-N-acetylmuramate: L-alanyl-gamma-D-glutamyl-meso-diaminopimelate ligase